MKIEINRIPKLDYGWIDGQKGGRMFEWTDCWMDGSMSEQKEANEWWTLSNIIQKQGHVVKRKWIAVDIFQKLKEYLLLESMTRKAHGRKRQLVVGNTNKPKTQTVVTKTHKRQLLLRPFHTSKGGRGAFGVVWNGPTPIWIEFIEEKDISNSTTKSRKSRQADFMKRYVAPW